MRFPEPVITTTKTERGHRVTARYETPELARLNESIAAIVMVGSTAMGLIGCWAGLSWLVLDARSWIAAMIVGTIAAFMLAQSAGKLAYRHRFWARRISDARLDIELTRKSVILGAREYQRGPTLRFTAAAHRLGRHEERSERERHRLISTTYREAWQVWLQHGEDFVLLADVSDERGAATIVRRLQEADEQVTRGQGTAAEADAFGMRQCPA